MTLKKKKNKNTPVLVTVKELKTWLDGYCSAHGAGWSPTPEQWEMIRNKIFSLEENVNEYASATSAAAPAYSTAPPPLRHAPRPGLVSESQYQASLDTAGSYGATGAHLVGVTDRPTFVQGKNGAVKTPDNLSDVTLPSSFA